MARHHRLTRHRPAHRSTTAGVLPAVALTLTLTACGGPGIGDNPGAAPAPVPPPAAAQIRVADGGTATGPLPFTAPPAITTGAAPVTAAIGTAAIGTAAPTGTGWAPPPVDGPPAAPRLTPLPGDYATPTAAAAAYLTAWCHTTPDQPVNGNIEQAVPWLTADGWADDQARGLDPAAWATRHAGGVGTACGPVTAVVSPQAPASDTLTWVAVTATQVRVRGGAVIGSSPVTQLRRVLRTGDGRWLVDVRVAAG